MFPATLDDVFLEEMEEIAAGEAFERHGRYLDRCRRVRVGPAVVALFENSRTLHFRVQELARLARSAGVERVARELDWYRSLLPDRHSLVASVTVRGRDRTRPDFAGATVSLHAGGLTIPGDFHGPTAGDRVIGLTRWVRFDFPPTAAAALADYALPLHLSFDSPAVQCDSAPLDPAVRHSLLADLRPAGDN